MTEAALAARRSYDNEWAKKNRAKRNESSRKWRKKHPEKVKAARDRYWERRAEKMCSET